ncbi:putative secreted protein with PEP-CTERM sorting signal [Prosthecobacter fusiformis]|uniref:Putative secreted protein with PEP-CTERM sorting signal n=2 Tax=Prosthecobacter fusiformis TaxID=48464 RepID=A0A4R7SS86_9BACT|nr:putative secreted protein with PEP-CTERM sorting signal [Prosthecobacter fusiformis]
MCATILSHYRAGRGGSGELWGGPPQMKLISRFAILVFGLQLSGSFLNAQSVWNVTTGNWNVAANWLPATLPVSANDLHLKFNATGSYVSTNNLGPFTLNRLTVNNTGNGTLTLAASTGNTLTFAGANPTLDITGTALFTGLLAGNATITKTGSGTFIHDSLNADFTGTLIINEGRFMNRSETNTVTNFTPAAIIVNNGGTYQFGNIGAGNPDLPISTYITANEGGLVSWQETQTFGGFHLLGGTLSLTSGTATANGLAAQSWTHGNVTGNAYTGTIYNMAGTAPINKTTSGTVTISGAVAMTNQGGLNIMEGTVIMSHATNLANAPLSLGGSGTTGTLEYQGGTGSQTGALTRASGGSGFVKVTQPTTILTLSGNQTGSGSLTKTGPGTLNLTGTLSGTGFTLVSEGTLRVNPGTAMGGFFLNSGTTLAVNAGSVSSEFSVPTLSLSTGTLLLELNTASVPSNSLVTVRNSSAFTFSDGATIRVTNAQNFANGTYTLLDYESGSPIESGLNLHLAGRTLGSLIYDTENTRIQMAITGTDTLKWSGAVSSAWDTGSAANVGGTQNWQLVTGGTATNFISTDTVRFDDTAANKSVQIAGTVLPFSITVDTAAEYSFSGTGKISGSTLLRKLGTGTLILATDNDYTGATSVTAGTLQLGDGGTQGSFTSALSLTASTLAFNRSADFTFDNVVNLTNSNTIRQNGTGTVTLNSRLSVGSNTLTFDGSGIIDIMGPISGTGTINKNGTGQLNLLGDVGFTGTLNINGGILQLTDDGAGGDLDAKSIVVNNGGTFIFGGSGNPDLPTTTVVTVNAGGLYNMRTGESYGGFILNGGEYRITSASAAVNSTGEAAAIGDVVFDLRSGTITTELTGTATGALVQGGGGVLAKTTSGTVTLTGTAAIHSALALQIREGTLSMPTVSVPTTGTVVDGTGTPLANIVFGTATTEGTLQIHSAGSATSSRNISVALGGGRVDVVEAATALTFSGAITGSGTLTKTGAGTLSLTGSLGSTGLTTVNEGILRIKPGTVTGALGASGSGVLAVGNGSLAVTLNVPALDLADGSTLQLELASSTLPGVTLANVTGTDGLTLAGDVTLRVTNSQPFANGLYTLIDYAGSSITSGFDLRLAGRTAATLIYNTADTQIQMNVTGTDTIKWTGAVNSTWDEGTEANVGGTQNWKLNTGGTATNYIVRDTVLFDDTAANRTVQLDVAVQPLSVTVNTASEYQFVGTGKISGSTSLTKSGVGTLVLATNNDYTGGTTVTGGSLQLGNGGTQGSIAGALSLTNSTLTFNRSDDITFANAVTLTGSNTIRQNGAGTVRLNSTLALGLNTLTFDGTGTLDMVGGITGSGIINKNGTGQLTLLGNHNFTGTLNINGGIVQLTDRGAAGDIDAVSIVVNNGGTFIFGPDANPDLPTSTFITINTGGLFEIFTGESYGGFILNGGEYRASSANSGGTAANVGDIIFDLRSGSLTASGTGGALSQGGGGVLAKTTSGTVTVGSGTTFGSSMPVQIREGILAMQSSSVPATGTTFTTGVLAKIEFGTATTQGTLQIQGTGTSSTSRGITVAAGGGRVDIVESGNALTFTGAVSGTGPLIKSGAGTLNINGAFNSTGSLSVTGGTLRLKPTAVASSLSLSNGTMLAVNSDAVITSLSVPTLTLAGGSTLAFELNSSTLPTIPLISVTGSNGLTRTGMSDTLLYLTNNSVLANGVYRLLDYAGTAITSGYTLQVAGRYTGTLNYDTANTQITATITKGEDIRWTGAVSGDWDAGTAVNVGGTQNWITNTSLASTNFVSTDVVYFTDTASTFNVNLTSALLPGSVFVNSTSSYTFGGAGKITGLTTLAKSGTGTLTLTTDNDYTGATTVSAGKLQLGAGGTTGSITSPVTLSGGALIFNRSDAVTHSGAISVTANTSASSSAPGSIQIIGSGDVTLSGIISGAATRPLQMDGSGTLFLRGVNTFTGLTIINSGTVSVASTTALGNAAADVLINGGTLQLTASTLGNVNNTATGRTITIGASGGTLDFRVNQTFGGNGFAGSGDLIKIGSGRLQVSSSTSAFAGSIDIREGSLLLTGNVLPRATNMTIQSGAQLIINDDVAGTWTLATNGKFTFNGDGGGEGVLRQYNAGVEDAPEVFTSAFDKEVVLNSASTLISTEAINGTISFTGNVTGVGGLTKKGPGTLLLTGGANSYQGGTLINAGTLIIANTTGSGTGSGQVVIGSGGRLMGTGSISGDTTLRSGATLQGGTAAARGTLTFTGQTRLENGSKTDFRLTADGSNDKLVFNILTIDSNASLRILLNYAAEEGDIFDLFDWTSLGALSDTNWVNNLDFSNAILADGLKWDTTLFNSSGILSVTIIPEPSRALLLLGGMMGLLFRRRRRE